MTILEQTVRARVTDWTSAPIESAFTRRLPSSEDSALGLRDGREVRREGSKPFPRSGSTKPPNSEPRRVRAYGVRLWRSWMEVCSNSVHRERCNMPGGSRSVTTLREVAERRGRGRGHFTPHLSTGLLPQPIRTQVKLSKRAQGPDLDSAEQHDDPGTLWRLAHARKAPSPPPRPPAARPPDPCPVRGSPCDILTTAIAAVAGPPLRQGRWLVR
jgi:hypothetical protein